MNRGRTGYKPDEDRMWTKCRPEVDQISAPFPRFHLIKFDNGLVEATLAPPSGKIWVITVTIPAKVTVKRSVIVFQEIAFKLIKNFPFFRYSATKFIYFK